MAKFDKLGREIPDPTPVELPVGFRHPPSLADEIRRLVEVNLSQAAQESGSESLDEASDFDVEDDEELVISGLQLRTMQDERILREDSELAESLIQERDEDGRRRQIDDIRTALRRSGTREVRAGIRDSGSVEAGGQAKESARDRGSDAKAGSGVEGDTR